jgi:hypothetical protein
LGSVQTIENVGLVTSIDVGWHRVGVNQNAYICYDKDSDGDLNTADKAVFLKNLSQ